MHGVGTVINRQTVCVSAGNGCRTFWGGTQTVGAFFNPSGPQDRLLSVPLFGKTDSASAATLW